jgi:hypothetical protein
MLLPLERLIQNLKDTIQLPFQLVQWKAGLISAIAFEATDKNLKRLTD